MNFRTILTTTAIAIALSACNSESNTAEIGEAGEVSEATEQSVIYAVDTESSSLAWLGKELSGKTHNGLIAIQEGSLAVDNGNIVAGSFTVDMNSIENLDVEDPEWNAKLVGHLKDTSFFAVAEYPTSSFELTGVEAVEGEEGVSHHVTGNFTMKGITHELKIPAMITISDDQTKAHAEFTIDRSKWEVKFRSGSFFEDLGDKLILDDITLTLDLVTAPNMDNTTASATE